MRGRRESLGKTGNARNSGSSGDGDGGRSRRCDAVRGSRNEGHECWREIVVNKKSDDSYGDRRHDECASEQAIPCFRRREARQRKEANVAYTHMHSHSQSDGKQ